MLIQDIQEQFEKEEGITEEFLEEVAEAYSLPDKKEELKRFIKHIKQCQTDCVCGGSSVSVSNESGDQEPPFSTIIHTNLPLGLPLNEKEQSEVDADIKDFVENHFRVEDEFIDYLLETYPKLQAIKPQVISYFQSYKAALSVNQLTAKSTANLTSITDFSTKKTKSSSARLNQQKAQHQVASLREYFTMDALKMTFRDFNRVQTRLELNQRVRTIELLKDQPDELKKFIINTIFGCILRKEDLSMIQSELQSVIQDLPISLRFLISYLIQSADMGLRARLSYYLCQQKAVPLIMNCQETYKDFNLNSQYNQELFFSMEECEGVGVFSFGIGRMANFACGKSEISNLIVTPKFENKSFDTNDMNVFSNGQIDVFLERCYSTKNGWAYMDGQGEIPNKNLKSILPLTNIVMVHFFEQEATDKISIEKLIETIKLIKENDDEILVCLILRDCSETKVIEKGDYPEWLPMKEQIDQIITLVNLDGYGRQTKWNKIEKVVLYFNTKVRQINQSGLNKQKFTKERFLKYFCQSDDNGKAKLLRISETQRLANDFLKEVNDLNANFFDKKEGLLSLKIKDEMHTISLKLRSFTVLDGEDYKTAVKRESDLIEQLKQLNNTLQELEINTIMQKFYKIVNHKDSVLIKIQLSKGLLNFTKNNTKDLVEKKMKYIYNINQNQIGLNYQEIQDEIKKFEEEIYQRSLSIEQFWRSLFCVMIDSKKCTYWQNEIEKFDFTQSIRQQILDGDTFELVDGRNLEIKGDIIREILGNDIESARCIVVCVIGPQWTGKSTLINSIFGTQFLTSTGKCTQGINFTLQKIPPELKQRKDVEYLIILDTEGLNCPERAEPEYDRKIVMFALLCSDFLIVNSRGDMTYQMKELIKICAVRYDQLRGNAKVPKILYTFVQNSDTNPANFMAQVSNLKQDVIECSTSQTIIKTVDQLMNVNENQVQVMGSAYEQHLIERDEQKGLFNYTYINTCAPLFGVQSSQVWLEVQKLFLQKDYQCRQIGTWLSEAKNHWTLIERHGAKIIEHQNVFAIKIDQKLREYFFRLWNEYLYSGVSEKDNIKAKKYSQIIFDRIQEGHNLNEQKGKFIKANDEEKSIEFDYMWCQFERWKQEPSQKKITVDLETKHKLELMQKMDLLKENFKLLLQSKLKELQIMTMGQNSVLSDLLKKARLLSQTIKQTDSQNEKDKLINESFENIWREIMEELSGREQIEQFRFTNWKYFSSIFNHVNQFMSMIGPQEYIRILAAAESEDLSDNQGLPKKLIEYLVNYISKDAFANEKGQVDSKDQFKFDSQMLELLKDPSERIFCEKEKDKYLPLQTLFKVNYAYEIVKNMLESLNMGSFYDQIWQILSQQTEQLVEQITKGFIQNTTTTKIVDDEEQIIKSISSLFQDFGQAGFGIQEFEKDSMGQLLTSFSFTPLSNPSVIQNFKQIFNNFEKKQLWFQSFSQKITWKKSENMIITSTVQKILGFPEVNFDNQINHAFKFDEHLAQSAEMQNSVWCNRKPKISYEFSKDSDGGKINVDKLMQENNMIKERQQYFQCIINPAKYELSDSQKWTNLSQVAQMLVNWEKIVLTINEKVSYEMNGLQSLNQNQVDEEFDLKNVLERNQITLEHANRININYLQRIQQELDDELQSKLALLVHPTLSGVITWVACVIVWYKSQRNILAKINEYQKKVETQKEAYRKNFREIAIGGTVTDTKQ